MAKCQDCGVDSPSNLCSDCQVLNSVDPSWGEDELGKPSKPLTEEEMDVIDAQRTDGFVGI